MNKFKKYLLVGFLLVGFGLLGNGIYIQVKAFVAQVMIENAWYKTQKNSKAYKPWPWADTKTIAKMSIPKIDKEYYILEGDSAQSLAFGPGHSSISMMPGQNGTILISAHRDTHFLFLKDVKINDEIILYDMDKNKHKYRINDTRIIDVQYDKIPILKGLEELVLVTCWPFDALRDRKSVV